MKITLNQDQAKEVALTWIKEQQNTRDGYKLVLDTLFMGGHFAKWSWFDALQYAVTKCGKYYTTGTQWIIDNFDRK